MARHAKLNKKLVGKITYWHTRAGGQGDTYFGRVGEVSFADANAAFRKHLAKEATRQQKRQAAKKTTSAITVKELADKRCAWLLEYKSKCHYENQRSFLSTFANHEISEGRTYGELAAIHVDRETIEQFITSLSKTKSEKTGDYRDQNTLVHITKAIKAAWEWASGNKEHLGGLLPKDHRPLTDLPATFKRIKMTEADLITVDEIDALLRWADWDTDKIRDTKTRRYRTRDATEQRLDHSWTGFGNLLTCHWETGVRTGELASATVRDYSPRRKVITLKEHKRVNTMADSKPRVIYLTDEANDIVAKNIAGKAPTDPIFTHGDGLPYSTDTITKRFRQVRELAGIRKHLTIYAFRHLWISEAMQLGKPIAKVAELAGTSITEIERTYGHFFDDDLSAEVATMALRASRRAG
ncbi:MAG TPA: tyrosine-type recombinase/integrase [Pirellulaceae bacterium]|nr:tyrosine-type recombinase/integrase [Pirellulaceae bacterium]